MSPESVVSGVIQNDPRVMTALRAVIKYDQTLHLEPFKQHNAHHKNVIDALMNVSPSHGATTFEIFIHVT